MRHSGTCTKDLVTPPKINNRRNEQMTARLERQWRVGRGQGEALTSAGGNGQGDREVDIERHGLGVPEEERRMQTNGDITKGHGYGPPRADEKV